MHFSIVRLETGDVFDLRDYYAFEALLNDLLSAHPDEVFEVTYRSAP